jgi:fatty acid desaturase
MNRSGPSTAALPDTVEGGPLGPGHAPGDPSSEHPLHRLSPEQLDEIATAFERIHDETKASLGARDATYIRRVIRGQRQLAVAGRALLFAGRWKPAWVAGTAALTTAKILENMEIGHNVMHGQWDWMNDPYIHSSNWEWDSAVTSASWKHSHNYIHHTYTNIVGKDKDVGYEVFRVSPKQEWKPEFLLQPISNALLMVLFEWGVMIHDLDLEAIEAGTKDMQVLRGEIEEIAAKATNQIIKDYVAYPALSGRGWKATLAANLTANTLRNVWTNAIIFCGHFPDQAWTFTEEEVAGETRGAWYVRQLLGAVNIEGGKLFHLMSGNLSYQVEHHLFPDMPSSRYSEIAPRVRAICEQYDLPYNSGPFWKQWLMVQRMMLRMSFPGGKERKKQSGYRAARVTR